MLTGTLLISISLLLFLMGPLSGWDGGPLTARGPPGSDKIFILLSYHSFFEKSSGFFPDFSLCLNAPLYFRTLQMTHRTSRNTGTKIITNSKYFIISPLTFLLKALIVGMRGLTPAPLGPYQPVKLRIAAVIRPEIMPARMLSARLSILWAAPWAFACGVPSLPPSISFSNPARAPIGRVQCWPPAGHRSKYPWKRAGVRLPAPPLLRGQRSSCSGWPLPL